MRRVFVTRRREYHCAEDLCFAVRDRGMARFVPHDAIGRRLCMSATLDGSGEVTEVAFDRPQVGQKLCFCDAHGFVITSRLVAIVDGSVRGLERVEKNPPAAPSGSAITRPASAWPTRWRV